LEGLRGAADTKGYDAEKNKESNTPDGIISISEAFEYASQKTVEYTNGFQNPQIKYKKGYEESLKTLPLIIVPK